MSNPSKNIPTATNPNTLRCSRVIGSRSSLAPMLIDDICASPRLYWRGLFDHRNSLDFDEHARIGKAGYRDCGARGKIRSKEFGPNLGHPRCVASIGQEDRHGDDVLQGPASLFQSCFDIAKRLVGLSFEVACQRLTLAVLLARVPSDPNDLAAFRYDCRRKGPGLLPRAANECFLHGPPPLLSTCDDYNRLQGLYPPSSLIFWPAAEKWMLLEASPTAVPLEGRRRFQHRNRGIGSPS